ncbi:MAG: LamG domain-containing protein, partial [Proteobacteria bacterium]|nr:LamG domain-containing protein [Pseudomonadota bacterium]
TWNYQGTDLKNLSANWQSSYTTVSSNSANWSAAYQYATAYNLSASKYNSTYSTVNSNSATWGSSTGDAAVNALVHANSGYWNSSYTTLTTSSASWQSTYTTVSSNSANWSTAYNIATAYQSASGSYAHKTDLSQYLPLSGGTITGSISATTYLGLEPYAYTLIAPSSSIIPNYSHNQIVDSLSGLDPVLLLHFNGTNGSTNFTDSSRYNTPITVVGNPIISTTQSKFGGASFFSDDPYNYITVPSTNLRFGTGDFTIECWVYLESFDYEYASIMDGRSAPGFYNFIAGIYNIDGDGIPRPDLVFGNTNGVSNLRLTCTTTSVTVGEWTHIAFVRKNGLVSIYVNGVADDSTVYYPYTFNPLSNTILIGSLTDALQLGGYYPFNGYIDELRVLNGTAAYSTNFTPANQEFTAPTGTSSKFSSILGGVNNKIAGDNSIIVGGTNNVINGSNITLIGSNLSASTPYYTYVNNISSQGTVQATQILVNGAAPIEHVQFNVRGDGNIGGFRVDTGNGSGDAFEAYSINGAAGFQAFNRELATTVNFRGVAKDFYILNGTTAGNVVENFRITSSGNVGIGTTTPNQKLTVSGNISASDTVYSNTLSAATIIGIKDVQFTGNTTTATTATTALNTFIEVKVGGVSKYIRLYDIA